MGRLGELARLLPVQAGDMDDQRHDQAEGVAVGADADLRGHRGVAEGGLVAARDQAQRAVEAGGVAGREQLLGVGPGAGAAHLRGERQIEVDLVIGGGDVAVAAIAGGGRLGGVENGVGHTWETIAADPSGYGAQAARPAAIASGRGGSVTFGMLIRYLLLADCDLRVAVA